MLTEVMKTEPQCPKCQSEYTYADGALWVCPSCAYEWSSLSSSHPDNTVPAPDAEEEGVIRDAHGTPLTNGDSVTVIKDLKVKGASAVVKVGTKVKNIRLVDSDDGHNIACKIDGIGAMSLKSEFVKKLTN